MGFSLPTYFAGIKTEWFKITWPTPVQLVGQVVVVVAMVTAMTLLLWLMDNIFRWGVTTITHRGF
jgi:preprotein translocase SecE subunit